MSEGPESRTRGAVLDAVSTGIGTDTASALTTDFFFLLVVVLDGFGGLLVAVDVVVVAPLDAV